MSNRKTLVLDTSVLLYDMQAIHSFYGNDVVIPLVVLDELDRFKEKPGLLGESARYVNRFLDGLRDEGRLDLGIKLENNDQVIRVEARNSLGLIPEDLDATCGDNKIIGCALLLKKENKEALVKVITKDINLRVKCDALEIEAEDYYKDHINIVSDKQFTGQTTLNVSDDDIDKFYKNGTMDVHEDCELYPNEFVVALSEINNKSALGVFKEGKVKRIPSTSLNESVGIDAKNKEQSFAMHLLADEKIELVTITGLAGSGKTFLTIMCGLSGLFNDQYKRIIITRSIQPVGRDLGYLPGDIDEKMDPWIAPIMDNVKHAFNDMTYFDCLRDKGQIEIAPLSYIRGRTFNDSYIIVDEAQNTTIHELKTIITRTGKGSKIILLGDTDQVDTPYIDTRSNGLSIVLEKFKESEISGHVHLAKGQRSEIATLASKIL